MINIGSSLSDRRAGYADRVLYEDHVKSRLSEVKGNVIWFSTKNNTRSPGFTVNGNH